MITADHVRQWKEMAGEASDILRLHDDTVGDQLSAMKIFYRDRLFDLENKIKALEEELAQYRPKPEQVEEPKVNSKPTKLATREKELTDQEKEAFIAAHEDDNARDIAMRMRIRKMRDNEKLDPMHAKRSYSVTNDRVISVGFGDRVQNFKFPQILGEHSQQKENFEMIKHLIDGAAFGGKKCSVFAYGQTGSGKTYTVSGGERKANGIVQ